MEPELAVVQEMNVETSDVAQEVFPVQQSISVIIPAFNEEMGIARVTCKLFV